MINFEQIDIIPHLIDVPNPRVGVATLSTDFTIEQDYRRICHNIPIDIFVNRIPFDNPMTHENYLKMADRLPKIAENILPGQNLNTVAFGCTSGTVAIGEEKITSQIRKSKPGVYVTTPITAALRAFKKLNICKIAILTPYPKLVNQTVYEYLKDKQIEIDTFSGFNLEYDSDIAKVDPQHLIKIIKDINLLYEYPVTFSGYFPLIKYSNRKVINYSTTQFKLIYTVIEKFYVVLVLNSLMRCLNTNC